MTTIEKGEIIIEKIVEARRIAGLHKSDAAILYICPRTWRDLMVTIMDECMPPSIPEDTEYEMVEGFVHSRSIFQPTSVPCKIFGMRVKFECHNIRIEPDLSLQNTIT